MAQVSPLQAHTIIAETPILPLAGPRRGTILVVEDRDDVREGLAQLLELNGFLVRDAATGEEALRQLHETPAAFALILLDLMLPGPVSGGDVRARQLADPATALVPAVVTSACEPEQTAQAQLRPVAWLEKPFRFETLLAIVREHVIPER